MGYSTIHNTVQVRFAFVVYNSSFVAFSLLALKQSVC